MLAELLAVSKFVAFGLIIDLLHVLQSFPFQTFLILIRIQEIRKKFISVCM